jgi:hypothetical protein
MRPKQNYRGMVPGSADEAASKLGITGNRARPAPEARKTIARGERSEPLVGEAIEGAPEGRKILMKKPFALSGLFPSQSSPGVRFAHPWLFSSALPGRK